jgi:hypothetical protein
VAFDRFRQRCDSFRLEPSAWLVRAGTDLIQAHLDQMGQVGADSAEEAVVPGDGPELTLETLKLPRARA